jgi:hypothetical protein
VRLVVPSVLLCALALLGAGSAGAARGCRTVDHGTQAETVLGHFATASAASEFLKTLAVKGFKGFTAENDGCGDLEIQSDAIRQSQRSAFALEAAKSGVPATFEQSATPMRPVRGYVTAVFGVRPTLTAAAALAERAAGVGFQYVDIAYGPQGWRVVEPRIPVAGKTSFRAEAARAKLPVTFAP